ncbi:MAG: O-antigen ligase family protein [Miltoncostaeaceae bacterium]
MPERLAVALLVATAAVLAAAYAFLSFTVAAQQDDALLALLVVAAAPALLAMAVAPSLIMVALTAALVANAGLVLNIQFGVPSVVRGLAVVGLLIAVERPFLRRGLFRAGPVLAALAAYAVVRLGTAMVSPRVVEFGAVAQELAYGLAIVALLGLGGLRMDWARRTALALVGATATLCVAALAREYGLIDGAFGFAEYQALTPDLQQIVNRSLVPIDLGGRIGGPVAEPNFWAQMLVFVLPIALWATWRRAGAARALGVVAVASIALALVQTSSRGGLLAAGVALVVLCLLGGPRARRLAVLVPIVLAAGLMLSGGADRFVAITQVLDPAAAEDEAVRGRASENLAAVEMLGDHLFTGVGAGNYPSAYVGYAAEVGLDARNAEREAHNSYLEAAAESGILGGMSFLALMIVGVAAPLRARRRLLADGRTEGAGLAAAVAAGLAGYAVGAAFLHQGFPEYTWLALGFSAMVVTLARGAPAPGKAP